jgi:hypothetical protein
MLLRMMMVYIIISIVVVVRVRFIFMEKFSILNLMNLIHRNLNLLCSPFIGALFRFIHVYVLSSIRVIRNYPLSCGILSLLRGSHRIKRIRSQALR